MKIAGLITSSNLLKALYDKETRILQYNLETDSSEASALKLEQTVRIGADGGVQLEVVERRTLSDHIVQVTHSAHSKLIRDRQLNEYAKLLTPITDSANPIYLGTRMNNLHIKLAELNNDPANNIVAEELVSEIDQLINASNQSSRVIENAMKHAMQDNDIWLNNANQLLQQLHSLNLRMHDHKSVSHHDHRDKLLLELSYLMDFSRAYDDKGRVSISKDGIQLVIIDKVKPAILESSYRDLYSGSTTLSSMMIRRPELSHMASATFKEGRLGAAMHFMNELLPQVSKKLHQYKNQVADILNRYHTSASSYPAQTSFIGSNKVALSDVIYTQGQTRVLLVQDNGMPLILDNLGNSALQLDFDSKTIKEVIEELNQCLFTGLVQPMEQIGPIERIELIPISLADNTLTFNLKITNTLRSPAEVGFTSLNNSIIYVYPGTTILTEKLTTQLRATDTLLHVTVEVVGTDKQRHVAVLEYTIDRDINPNSNTKIPVSKVYDSGYQRSRNGVLPKAYAMAALVDDYGQEITGDGQPGYLSIKGQGIRIVLLDDTQQGDTSSSGFLQQCGINQLVFKRHKNDGRLDLALNPDIKTNPLKFARSSLISEHDTTASIPNFSYLQLAGEVQVNDTISIGQKEFTFIANGQQEDPGEIAIGADTAGTLANIARILATDEEIAAHYNINQEGEVLKIAVNPFTADYAARDIAWNLDEAMINGQSAHAILLSEPQEENRNLYRIDVDQAFGFQSLFNDLQSKPNQEFALLNSLITNAAQEAEDQEKVSAAKVQTADQEWRSAAKIDTDIANQQLTQLSMIAKAIHALWRDKLDLETELQRLLMRS